MCAGRLQEKLKQKRAERLLQEKKVRREAVQGAGGRVCIHDRAVLQDLVEREKIRRRSGKEISDARQQ